MAETDLAVAFLRNDGELLLVQRSSDESHSPGRWTVPSGVIEEEASTEDAARTAIESATGVGPGSLTPIREAGAVHVDRDGQESAFRPILFDCSTRAVEPDDRWAGCEWTHATALLHRDADDGLWDAYERVAPTVRSIAADDEHGAAYLSVRALEALRDRAGRLAVEESGGAIGETDTGGSDAPVDGDALPGELASLGRRLRRARPSMAVVRNRINRALGSAGPTPEDVERAVIEGIERAVEVDRGAAEETAEAIEGDRVLTLSRSGTVLEALSAGTARAAYVAESRPAREGIEVAEVLADALPVTVHTDAAIAHVLASERVDAVLVGADTVLPDGTVINKAGTRAAALAAAREGVPVYVAAATDKVTTREAINLEAGDAAAVYDGDADLDALNPTFDRTPPDLVAGIVSERGLLAPEDVREVAAEHRSFERAVE